MDLFETTSEDDRAGVSPPAVQASGPAITLTPEQQQTVNEFARPVLCISLPGTGKTTIVAAKHIRAVELWGPGACLSITFTKKAANEIRDRIRAARSDDAGPAHTIMETGTFHSVATRILSAAASRRLYDGPTMMATKEEIDQILVDTAENGASAEGGRTLREALQRAKNAGLTPVQDGYATIAGEVRTVVEGMANTGSPTHDAMVEYQRRLRHQRLLDFDDALIQATLMIRQHRSALLPNLRAVVIDEFQDVNDSNVLMIEALAEGISLTCCGDDDQAVYHWRGAKVEHIQNFTIRYPDALVTVLHRNFRSTPGVAKIADRIMTGVRGRIPKTTVAQQAASDTPMTIHVYRSRSPGYNPAGRGYEPGLATFTAAVCRRALAGRPRSDLIVLARTNETASMIRDALEQDGQETRISNPSSIESVELRSLISWIHLLTEPAAEGPVSQLSGTPSDERHLRDLSAMARLSGRRLIDLLGQRRRDGRLRDARLADVVDNYERLRQASLDMSAARLAEEICQTVLDARRASRDPAKIERFWRAYASILPALQDGQGLRAALEQLQGGLSEDDLDDGRPKIEVSTMHAVKGRQKPIVVISAAADGIMPGRKALQAGMSSKEMEGERRLFYVAASRAREHVHLITVEGAKSCMAHLATDGMRDCGTVIRPD